MAEPGAVTHVTGPADSTGAPTDAEYGTVTHVAGPESKSAVVKTYDQDILAMALGSVQSDLERVNMRLADFEGHKRRAQDREVR